MSTRATISGSLGFTAPSGTSGPSVTFPFRVLETYSFDDCHVFSGAQSDAAVPLGPITNVKALVGYADSAIDLRVTSANGTDQVIPLQGLFVWTANGRPITAIKLNGTAAGKLFFAGD